jgi:hypothetical protein
MLQHKLRVLQAPRKCPIEKMVVSLATTGYSLFQLDKNTSIIYKKQQKLQLHKIVKTPPSYRKRHGDGITLPQKDTFLNAYKVLFLNLLPFKIKETTFQVLTRTIWT